MADFEGSANVEGFDEVDETSEDTTTENINNSTEEETNSDETKKEETPEGDSEQVDSEVKLTDKGTKLDPNPQSAHYQELANAKREAAEMRTFMQDPRAVKRYLEDLEAEVGSKTGESKTEVKDRAEDENLITDPTKIVTPEDFTSYVKFLSNDLKKAKEELLAERDNIRKESSEKAIAEKITNEITGLQTKYSFLRPKNADGTPNPEFDAEFEKEIGDQYDEYDFDKSTGKYLGKVSIAAIAERAIRIRKLGEATGSKKAQTTVIDKRQGAIKTSSGGSASPDESKMSASQMIASRMANARRNR